MTAAVITGTTSGLGRKYVDAVIEKYPEIDEIWMIARRVDRLKKIEKEYPQKKFRSISLDLTKDESYLAFAELLTENKPDIRILVSNSAQAIGGNVEEMAPEDMMSMIDLNVKGATLITRLCLPYMKRDSFIVEVCSVSSFAPNPHLDIYSASKAYLASFSLGLRQELKGRGINVCAVHPGRMDTEMNQGPRQNERTGGAFELVPSLDVGKMAFHSLKVAEKGRASYTMGAFYKFYRVLAKIFPHLLVVKFSKV